LFFRVAIAASLEQAFHRGGTSRADGTVQGRGAVFVLGMNVRPGIKQTLDRLHLPLCIPNGSGYVAIRCVVQGAALTVIRFRIWVGSSGQQ